MKKKLPPMLILGLSNDSAENHTANKIKLTERKYIL